MSKYVATFETGTGNWSIQLGYDCDQWDLKALVPVIKSMKDFVEPTIEKPLVITPRYPKKR